MHGCQEKCNNPRCELQMWKCYYENSDRHLSKNCIKGKRYGLADGCRLYDGRNSLDTKEFLKHFNKKSFIESK